MKLKKKGIVFVVALLVLGIVGFAGYKVYSYYWTQGEFSGGTSSGNEGVIILEKAFAPRVNRNPSDEDEEEYLDNNNNGHYINLSCTTVDASGYTNCTGGTTVINRGTDPLDVVVSNATYTIGYGEPEELSLSAFNWTNATTTIASGASSQLVVTINNLQMLTQEELTEPIEVSSSVTDDYRTVEVRFNLTVNNHVE